MISRFGIFSLSNKAVFLTLIDLKIPLASHGFNQICFSLLVVGLSGAFLFVTSKKF